MKEPVEVALDVAHLSKEELVRSLRVAEYDAAAGGFAEVPSQLLAATPAYQGTRIRVAFEASVEGHGSRDYLVCYDNPDALPPVYRGDLVVSAPADGGLGYEIETPDIRASLDARSGQLATFQPRGGRGEPLTFRADPVHWNPDVVPAPPRQSYYNVRRWDPPAETTVVVGPLLMSIARFGPLAFSAERGDAQDPGVPEVEVSITYTFTGHQPYVLQTSAVSIVKDTELHAIRNGGELTFGAGLFTDAVWKGQSGEIRSLSLGGMEGRDVDARRGGRVAGEVDWLAFVNRTTGSGVATIYLSHEHLNVRDPSGLAPLHDSGLYVFAAVEGDFYFRAPVWEYALYDRDRAPAVLVPAGSVYYERNAWLPLEFDWPNFEALDTWRQRLLHPLDLSYESRDDRELANIPQPGPNPRGSVLQQ